jgi:hypothetical protein
MSLFSLGQVVMTRGAIQAFEEAQDEPWKYINKHSMGNWGEVDQEDWKANDEALLDGDRRMFSAYQIKGGQKIWIITEADRSSTCVLLPEEY